MLPLRGAFSYFHCVAARKAVSETSRLQVWIVEWIRGVVFYKYCHGSTGQCMYTTWYALNTRVLRRASRPCKERTSADLGGLMRWGRDVPVYHTCRTGVESDYTNFITVVYNGVITVYLYMYRFFQLMHTHAAFKFIKSKSIWGLQMPVNQRAALSRIVTVMLAHCL